MLTCRSANIIINDDPIKPQDKLSDYKERYEIRLAGGRGLIEMEGATFCRPGLYIEVPYEARLCMLSHSQCSLDQRITNRQIVWPTR